MSPSWPVAIILKTAREIMRMRQAGIIVADTLKMLSERIRPGITRRQLDLWAHEFIVSRGGYPTFKGYRGYPASICVSVDAEVVHGIPDDRVLEEGQIVSLDVGVTYRGWVADAAVTVPVGKVSPAAEHLIGVCREALYRGIDRARPGHHLSDISAAIQQYVEANGCSVVRDYVGHGIGRNMHEEPQVPNFGPPGMGPILRPGMTLAIEPMVNLGAPETKVLADGWTVVTADGSLSAHFEHTIAITEADALILTAADL
jgi:methionyl aminopeptidase